jgi:outer membrane phospholipase A
VSNLLRAAALLGLLLFAAPARCETPEWVVGSSDSRAVAGERFDVIVVSILGAAPPDEMEARLKVGPDERVVTLSATAPAEGARRTYFATMPSGIQGPVSLELVARASSVLVLLVEPPRPPTPALPASQAKTEFAGTDLPLSEYDPMYFVVGGHDSYSAKFQLSFKYRLFDQSAGFGQDQPWLSGLYFGYTQTSLWDLSEQSKPFRDTDYRPALFWRWQRTDDNARIDAFQVGLEHESNGGGVTGSRSIDTAFIRPEWRWKYADGSRLDFTPKIYGYINKDENPDIDRYRGNVDWRIRYDSGVNWIGTGVVRYANTAGRGSVLLDLSRRIRDLKFGPVGGYLHFQLFTGYGEELLDYNVRRSLQFRVGFAIVP